MGKPPNIEQLVRIGARDRNDFDRAGLVVLECLEQAYDKYSQGKKFHGNLLDLGCGCGRVSLPLISKYTDLRLFATDVDASNVATLPKNRVNLVPIVNQARPPLPFVGNVFDTVYAVSVWTHLNENLQFSWLSEVNRVLKPGGLALVTIAGKATYGHHERRGLGHTKSFDVEQIDQKGIIFIPQLNREERNWPGTEDYGLTFHSPDYVNTKWSKYICVIEVIKGGINGGQDIVVLQKKEV